MVKEGTFREDLYARLSTLTIDIKPLRDRMCDIQPIIESMDGGKEFLEGYRTLCVPHCTTIDNLPLSALDLSLNVRSLYQYIIRYKVLGEII
jgi:transcriptional regulator with PAS, ATPase and Fis domain